MRKERPTMTSQAGPSPEATDTTWHSGTWARGEGRGGYADVNGLHLYFEVHGPAVGSPEARSAAGAGGPPMILLHGGLGSGEMFGPVLPALTGVGTEKARTVITADLQGHGRTADIDRPIDPRLMGDDIAALIRHLGLERADVMGYSLGGGAALHAAARHPDLVRRAVIVSANATRDSFYPELRAQQGLNASMADNMKGTPMYEAYQRLAPRPEDFGRLLDKMGAWITSPFDFTAEYAALSAPTLIACADADAAPPRHYVELFESLGGGQRDANWDGSGRPDGGHALAIIPGETHYSIFMSPLLAQAAVAFLDR
jgi:pimeloyl-ACP methyl ester carboxylesterase